MKSTTQLIGLTAEGRTTIRLLQLNTPERIAERQQLEESGRQLEPPEARADA